MISLAGLLVALAVVLTGVGGGVLMTPLLILLFGLEPATAVGTALLFVTVVKLLAAPVYVLRRAVDWRAAALLLAGGLPGAWAGVRLHSALRASHLRPAVLVGVGATVVALALVSLCRTLGTDRASAGARPRSWLAAIGAPIGLEVGFSSAGAGALGNLALMQCTELAPAAIVGTDLVFGLGLAAAAGSMHLAAGNVDHAVFRALCLGGIPGALAGAWLATLLPARPFRTVLTLVLIYLGSHLVWDGVRNLAR
ncbi:MAG: sulfite exporter TauE/SafE family protein [Bryobacteraceae bacterium]